MKDNRNLDTHSVAHDALSLGFAVVFGGLATASLRSVETGLLMLAAVFAFGVLVMRVGPTRRTVNRLAFAVSERIH